MIDELMPDLRRLRADNPSPMTGTGTNTYLLGSGDILVIDPGPHLPAHEAAILAALRPGERIAAILVTHAHLDHSELAPVLAARTGAPVLAFGPAGSGRSARMAELVAAGLRGGGEGVDAAFVPDRLLSDGEVFDLGDVSLTALHTPGHMGGHLCFAWGDILFSGDHAMGWSTSLVSPPEGEMGAYIASLERLMARPWSLMLPGHGEAVTAPADRLAWLLQHRKTREAEVLEALRTGPADAATLAARIYRDTPAALLPAAARNTLAHLLDLEQRNLIAAEGALTASARFRRV